MAVVKELYRFPAVPNLTRSLELHVEGKASRFRLNQTAHVERKGKKFDVHNVVELTFAEMGQLVGYIDQYTHNGGLEADLAGN